MEVPLRLRLLNFRHVKAVYGSNLLLPTNHPNIGLLLEIAVSKQRPATFGLLICTLISENQGLEKSRSASNLSGPAHLDFFLRLYLEKKLDLYHKPEKNPGDKLKKNQDLKFSKV